MRLQRTTTPLITLFLVLLAACGGSGGGSEPSSSTLSNENTQPENSGEKVAGSTCSEVIESQSNTEIVLKNSTSYCDYFVDGEVEWEDVNVVVEPGTIIVFGEKAELEIEGGNFESIGTESLPIVFRGEIQTPG